MSKTDYEFTETEKGFLLDKVYSGNKTQFRRDLPQIEEAAVRAEYYYYDEKEREVYIDRDQARRMMGTEEWLSGISRAAFHWTSARTAKGGQTIFIDCRNMFG